MESYSIWRYLDLAKFIAIMQTNSLFLSRADAFADPFEGTINKATYENFKNTIKNELKGKKSKKVLYNLEIRWLKLPKATHPIRASYFSTL